MDKKYTIKLKKRGNQNVSNLNVSFNILYKKGFVVRSDFLNVKKNESKFKSLSTKCVKYRHKNL